MTAKWDTSEIDALARSFMAAPARVIPALVPVAHKAGANMKRTMKRDASGHRHLPGIPRYVSYDVEQDATSVTVDVGFRKEGQGNLANIAVFGSQNNAPVMDITRSLHDEVPNFMRWVAKIGSEAI